jgi:hypothetical protein
MSESTVIVNSECYWITSTSLGGIKEAGGPSSHSAEGRSRWNKTVGWSWTSLVMCMLSPDPEGTRSNWSAASESTAQELRQSSDYISSMCWMMPQFRSLVQTSFEQESRMSIIHLPSTVPLLLHTTTMFKFPHIHQKPQPMRSVDSRWQGSIESILNIDMLRR